MSPKPILELRQALSDVLDANREWLLQRSRELVDEYKLWRRQAIAIETAMPPTEQVFMHLYLSTTEPGQTKTGNPIGYTLKWERFLTQTESRPSLRRPYPKGQGHKYKTQVLCQPFAAKRPYWVAAINGFEDRAAAIRDAWAENQQLRYGQASFARKIDTVLGD